MISLFWIWMNWKSYPRKIQINDLPPELVQHIFAYLPRLEDRRKLSLVCQRWNDLAFDYNYLGHIRLNMWIGCRKNITRRLHKISRYYRNVISLFHIDLDEGEETDNILRWFKRFEKHSSSVEELVCYDSSRNCLSLKLISVCPRVKKLELHLNSTITVDKLPVVENLEELVSSDISTFGIIRLAPNLRRFEGPSSPDLPILFQKLPLEYLRVTCCVPRSVAFKNWTEPTKLTAVDLDFYHHQNDLEQLCKYCPLLTKLRINVKEIISLRCLLSLTHLKVLSFCDFDRELFLRNDVCFPSVEIVEFHGWEELHFDISWRRIFPKVHYLKCMRRNVWTDRVGGKINRSFPHLRTLEISDCKSADLLRLVEGLPDLRELILHKTLLLASHLPPMLRLQQLTLKIGRLKVTDGMAKNLPNLQFLNLRRAQCTDADKLPPSCTVRWYLRNSRDDIFDAI